LVPGAIAESTSQSNLILSVSASYSVAVPVMLRSTPASLVAPQVIGSPTSASTSWQSIEVSVPPVSLS